MGTVREYGFREYPDDLTPGNEGRSGLLFRDGRLRGHADFHVVRTERSDDAETYDEDEEHGKFDLTAVAKVLAGIAIAYVVVDVTRRVRRTIRARRMTDSPDPDAGPRSEAEDTLSEPETVEAGPEEALAEEVLALCEETGATMNDYQARLRARPASAPVDDPEEAAERRGHYRAERRGARGE